MATIRVHCRSCPTTTLLSPGQVLLVWSGGWGSYLFCCPACGRVRDGVAMIIPESLLWAWCALAAMSTAYVAWDNFGARNPEETVMKWGASSRPMANPFHPPHKSKGHRQRGTR